MPKDKREIKIVSKPEFYAVLYPSIKKAALELGYAIALHGSMHNDMDIIAVAWVEDAKPVEDLIRSINDCLGNTIWSEHNINSQNQSIRPHGRLSYNISIMGDFVIDISVIAPKSNFIGCSCNDNDKHGETSIMCCNHCGKPVEDFWVGNNVE